MHSEAVSCRWKSSNDWKPPLKNCKNIYTDDSVLFCVKSSPVNKAKSSLDCKGLYKDKVLWHTAFSYSIIKKLKLKNVNKSMGQTDKFCQASKCQ